MEWNWQYQNWPRFAYKAEVLEALERQFMLKSGEFLGAFRHMGSKDRDRLKIELIRDEALKTSEIEGELLDRDSVQSSLLHQFGLDANKTRVPDAERGISEMMVDLTRHSEHL